MPVTMQNRLRMALSVMGAGLTLGLMSAARAQNMGAPGDGPPDEILQALDHTPGQGGWVSQKCGDGQFRRFNDVAITTIGDRMYAGTPKPETVETAFLEIRPADNSDRAASIPVPASNAKELFRTGTVQLLDSFHLSDAPSIPDGSYVCAWVVNGQRRSNVLGIKIGPKEDISKLPRVRLTQIEPDKPGKLPTVLAVISRVTESDPAPDVITLSTGTLVLDGVALRRNAFGYQGGNATLPVGGTFSYPMSWENAQPDLSKPHTIAVRVPTRAGGPPVANGPFVESAPVPLLVGTPLADAWDRATPTLKPAPNVQNVVTGHVRAPRKAPPRPGMVGDVPQFDITVAAQDCLCVEPTNPDGFWSFRNLPAGDYRLTCTPRDQKFPQLTVDSVNLDPKTVPTLDLPLTPAVELSGRVSRADGAPAEKITVHAAWVSDDGHMNYQALALTAADGTYTLESPFPKNTEISYLAGDNEFRISRNQSGPAKDVNFTLPK